MYNPHTIQTTNRCLGVLKAGANKKCSTADDFHAKFGIF